jgi:hypothetical protein
MRIIFSTKWVILSVFIAISCLYRIALVCSFRLIAIFKL